MTDFNDDGRVEDEATEDAEEAEDIMEVARDAFQEEGLDGDDANPEADEDAPVAEVVDARRDAEVRDVQGVVEDASADEDDLNSAELLELARKFDGVQANPDEHDRLMAKRAEKILQEVENGEKY